MTVFPHFAEEQIRGALEQRRLVFVVGQRGGGLTHWLQHANLGAGERVNVDFAFAGRTPADFARFLSEKLQLDSVPASPNDVVPMLARGLARRYVVVCSNAHAAPNDVADWLLQALLNPLVDPGQSSFAFCVEGAIDVSEWLERCTARGVSQNPLAVHEASSSPWQRIVDAERFLAAGQRRLPAALVALFADYCHGDMRLMQDVVERLPEEEYLSATAVDSVMALVRRQGRGARELRESYRSMEALAQELVAQLAQGRVVVESPPGTLSSSVVRAAYLAGFATFDPVMCGYRVRGPLVADIVLTMRGGDSCTLPEPHGLAACLSWQASTLEFAIRQLATTGRIEEAARATQVSSGFDEIAKTAKRALASAGVSSGELAIVDRALKQAAGARTTVWDAARQRLGLERDPTPVEALEGMTFDELVSVAAYQGVIGASLRPALDGVRTIRNAVAHLRPVPVDDVLLFSRKVREIVREILRTASERPPT